MGRKGKPRKSRKVAQQLIEIRFGKGGVRRMFASGHTNVRIEPHERSHRATRMFASGHTNVRIEPHERSHRVTRMFASGHTNVRIGSHECSHRVTRMFASGHTNVRIGSHECSHRVLDICSQHVYHCQTVSVVQRQEKILKPTRKVRRKVSFSSFYLDILPEHTIFASESGNWFRRIGYVDRETHR